MALQRNDTDPGFDTLVHRHRAALMSWALRLTGGDHAWAEDVVQETFFRAWRHEERMSDRYGSVRSWLLRVAHNVAVDGHRARRTRPADAVEMERGLEPVRDFSPDVVSSLRFAEVLAGLADGHRAVLEEVYGRDTSLADAARRLGLPVGTVKSRVFYALGRLRDSLPGRDADPGSSTVEVAR